MRTYTPDRWVVVEVTFLDNNVTQRRILAGWSGGYMSGNSWKFSSVIQSETDFSDYIQFDNASGSRYLCYKRRCGMTAMSGAVLQDMEAQDKDSIKYVIDWSYDTPMLSNVDAEDDETVEDLGMYEKLDDNF
jgi:hypothetical protein